MKFPSYNEAMAAYDGRLSDWSDEDLDRTSDFLLSKITWTTWRETILEGELAFVNAEIARRAKDRRRAVAA